jgi:hypothetical protein
MGIGGWGGWAGGGGAGGRVQYDSSIRITLKYHIINNLKKLKFTNKIIKSAVAIFTYF